LGYNVVAVARRTSETLDAAIERSRIEGPGSPAFAPFDLADIKAIPEFARRIRPEVRPIYGLVNNAGIGTGELLGNMANVDIEAVLRLNSLSPIILTKYVVRGMMAQGRGRVVNMSSIIASTGYTRGFRSGRPGANMSRKFIGRIHWAFHPRVCRRGAHMPPCHTGRS
jgi:3-oxoacyl-[acyl-carrier protein] reductase